ncbi:MAG: hypothetical protein GXP43_01900 [bacterium]|nr:hypothetical protein [bacterium]
MIIKNLYRKINLFITWFFLAFVLTFAVSFLFIKTYTTSHQTTADFFNQKTASHYLLYSQFTSVPKFKVNYQTSVKLKDARVLILERYLNKYNSPMKQQAPQLAYKFVEVADKYQLPFTLLPAIAQCESNLGKYTPPNCYNAWGYGIHSRGTLCFDSWEEGIERVARGLSQDYLQEGRVNPENIMAKYTPLSNGSWARCVRFFTKELEAGVNQVVH